MCVCKTKSLVMMVGRGQRLSWPSAVLYQGNFIIIIILSLRVVVLFFSHICLVVREPS